VLSDGAHCALNIADVRLVENCGLFYSNVLVADVFTSYLYATFVRVVASVPSPRPVHFHLPSLSASVGA
jgi:hypothetical protein